MLAGAKLILMEVIKNRKEAENKGNFQSQKHIQFINSKRLINYLVDFAIVIQP
jgi:hypothetical protein